MKKMNYLLSAVVLLGVLFTIGCGGDDAPGITPEQAALTKLAKTWTATSVSFEGSTSTYADDFQSFTLTITGEKGYTTSGGPSPDEFGPFSQGSSTGSWDFAIPPVTIDDSAFKITRTADGLAMDVQASATNMSLTFSFTDNDGNGSHDGREEAVTGAWIFDFTAN